MAFESGKIENEIFLGKDGKEYDVDFELKVCPQDDHKMERILHELFCLSRPLSEDDIAEINNTVKKMTALLVRHEGQTVGVAFLVIEGKTGFIENPNLREPLTKTSAFEKLMELSKKLLKDAGCEDIDVRYKVYV